MKRRLVASCALAMAFSTTSVLAEISVDQGYVRATPPGVSNGAAFMTLHNSADQPVLLQQISTPVAANPELHQHKEHNGMIQMRQVESIEVPAHGSVKLQPGGYHVMLIGLNGPLKVGAEVELMLGFSDGQSLHLVLPVQKTQSPQTMIHGDHKMSTATHKQP